MEQFSCRLFSGMLGLIVLFILIAVCECVPRRFYHPAMCESRGTVDCSFQMVDPKNNACKVYTTSECHNFDFSHWMKQPPKHPIVMSDSIYSIDVFPFAMTDGERPVPYDAINITFTTLNQNVTGYVLLLGNSALDPPLNICRIFDFRNSRTKGYMTLFYDCLVSLTLYGVHDFELRVKALPHNEEMLYGLFLPDEHNIETDKICQWRPLVMVFKGGLQNNIVEIRFSQAPKHLNVSSYEVSLVSDPNGEFLQTVTIEATQAAFVHIMFSHVDRGSYFVYIKPLSGVSLDDCETKKYTAFSIENKLIDKFIVIYIITVCSIGVCIAIVTQLFLRWLFKPGSINSKPVVLLVFSYDCKEHNNVVLRYAKFLENQCGMKVLTIYGEQRSDPDLWLFGPYRNCDIVMIIVSEGVFYKCENSNSPAMREGYSCGDRLIPTLSYLKTKILSDKKEFIPVYFEYSGACHIPSFVQSGKWGKAFVVPREINYVLCKAYNQNPKIACLGVYPRMPGHDVVASPEGMALIESIEEMKYVLKRYGEDSVMMMNECIMMSPDFTCETGKLHTKDSLRNLHHDKPKYFPKSGQPADEERGYSGCGSRLGVPLKHCSGHSYGNRHVCDDENCAHLNLLQDSALSHAAKDKSNSDCNEHSIQRNANSDVLDSAEEMKTDRHLQDLQYILSKPGPSFPSPSCLDTLKFMK